MKPMTIANKLLLCFIALLALLTVLSVVAFSALGAMQSRPEQTASVAAKKLAPTGALQHRYRQPAVVLARRCPVCICQRSRTANQLSANAPNTKTPATGR